MGYFLSVEEVNRAKFELLEIEKQKTKQIDIELQKCGCMRKPRLAVESAKNWSHNYKIICDRCRKESDSCKTPEDCILSWNRIVALRKIELNRLKLRKEALKRNEVDYDYKEFQKRKIRRTYEYMLEDLESDRELSKIVNPIAIESKWLVRARKLNIKIINRFSCWRGSGKYYRPVFTNYISEYDKIRLDESIRGGKIKKDKRCR